ncbi:MAG: 3-oxoacyl-ACP reductase [Rhodospirillales bacterium 70-18]|nr:MAG: 3-oxoacyl-ACP reductase [Rhodospirillales bacterium 70-18]
MTDTRYPCLAGRAVIVTGGASGIGEAFVRAFASNGARVGLLDLDAAAGTALAEDVAASGAPRPDFVACDLLDIAALKAALDLLHARLGDAAVLVNNAANDRRQDFLEVTEAEFDWSLGVNFKHQYFAAQAVVPQMRALGFGSIINMSSVAWMGGGPSMQAYSAAKAAVVGFTNSLARDVGKWRIRVNAIAPGMVITPRQRALWFQDETQIAAGRARQSVPDAIEPADIAALGLFLAADDSRLITKQCFQVNGGSR